MPSAADLDDVLQCGSLQAGDHADAARKRRQRTLAFEEAFAAQSLLELAHRSQQGAEADLMHRLSDELHLPAAFVDAELAVQPDGVAILGLEAHQRGFAAEHHDGELRVAVFEREVAMPAGRWPPVGDLSFDGNMAVALLDERADLRDEVGDGPDARAVQAPLAAQVQGNPELDQRVWRSFRRPQWSVRLRPRRRFSQARNPVRRWHA